MLKICDIVKTFDDKKTAVDKVSINLYKDEIFALLGHNGAGKSTLISMLSGLYEATAGEAYYNGVNILDDTKMIFSEQNLEFVLNMMCYLTT